MNTGVFLESQEFTPDKNGTIGGQTTIKSGQKRPNKRVNQGQPLISIDVLIAGSRKTIGAVLGCRSKNCFLQIQPLKKSKQLKTAPTGVFYN